MDSEAIGKKSQRLRLYFAKTARDMILESGVESVSIRTIAKRAGYAYGTIYNHFGSLDELLWLTRNLFMADIGEHMDRSTMHRDVGSSEDVCELFGAYADYFISHPSVYRFLYLHPLKKEAKTAQSIVETDAHKQKFAKTFSYLAAQKDPQEIENALKTILYSIHGLLTLSISENDDLGLDTMRGELKRVIHTLLD